MTALLDYQKILETIMPLPFLGFTVCPDEYQKLMATIDKSDKDPFCGCPVVCVTKQSEPMIQWNDQKDFDLYVRAMESPFAP